MSAPKPLADAGQPAVDASKARIRARESAQMRVALPWAVRTLDLPTLDAAATEHEG